MATKDELITMADELGLDSTGTKAEIQERLDAHAESQDDDLDGEDGDSEEGGDGPSSTQPPKAAAPLAIAVKPAEQTVTAIALVTAVKMIAGWRHLVKGKPITAPQNVIDILREKKMVR